MAKKKTYTHFGGIVKDAMEEYGYSVTDFARIMHCDPRTIQYYLVGERIPSYITCIAIGAVLKLDHEFLWRLLEED